MQARTVSFYIHRDRVDEVLRVVDEEILPAYRALPHFVGLIVLQDDGTSRAELLGLSVWDGDLSDADAVIARFRQELAEIAGTAPTSAPYQVLRLVAMRSC